MSELDLPFAEARPGDVAPARSLGEVVHAACAWCLLVLIDLVVKLAGFHRFYNIVRSCPTIGDVPAHARAKVARRACSAVDRASVYYFKRAWCLQRSAAAVCFLRLCGIRGELVIGVQKIPFYAHAWAEVDGRVVNDHPLVKSTYGEIARC